MEKEQADKGLLTTACEAIDTAFLTVKKMLIKTVAVVILAVALVAALIAVVCDCEGCPAWAACNASEDVEDAKGTPIERRPTCGDMLRGAIGLKIKQRRT